MTAFYWDQQISGWIPKSLKHKELNTCLPLGTYCNKWENSTFAKSIYHIAFDHCCNLTCRPAFHCMASPWSKKSWQGRTLWGYIRQASARVDGGAWSYFLCCTKGCSHPLPMGFYYLGTGKFGDLPPRPKHEIAGCRQLLAFSPA